MGNEVRLRGVQLQMMKTKKKLMTWCISLYNAGRDQSHFERRKSLSQSQDLWGCIFTMKMARHRSFQMKTLWSASIFQESYSTRFFFHERLHKHGFHQKSANAADGWKGHRGDVMLADSVDILAQGSTYRVYRGDAAAAPEAMRQYFQAFLDAMLHEFPEYLSWPSLQQLQGMQQVHSSLLAFPPWYTLRN